MHIYLLLLSLKKKNITIFYTEKSWLAMTILFEKIVKGFFFWNNMQIDFSSVLEKYYFFQPRIDVKNLREKKTPAK